MQATMLVSGITRLAHYPFLRQHLLSINPRFAMLSSPIVAARFKKAAIEEMSLRSGMAQDHLICALEGLILYRKRPSLLPFFPPSGPAPGGTFD